MSRNYLSRGSELTRGDFLISNNGEWKAVFQDDGNFVVYGWNPVWASDTYGSRPDRLIMQRDGNLVMYGKGSPIWSTGTYSPACQTCRVQLTDEGNLILHKDTDSVWNSATSKDKKE